MNIIMASSRNHPHHHHQLSPLNRLLQQQQQQQPQQHNQQVHYHHHHQNQYQQQQQQQLNTRTSQQQLPIFNKPLPSGAGGGGGGGGDGGGGRSALGITNQIQSNSCNVSSTTTTPEKPSSPLDFTDRISFHELKLSTETLGSGSFGTVYKGRWRNRNVAVKQFRTREEIDSFLVEVKQLSCVKHPNIVTLYGASTLSDTAYLVMEYAEGGSLNRLLHECKQQQYGLRHACSWAMQTARGVAYLHSIRPKPIMHRDLKPANLLLFQRGKILKICDFGTACTVKTQMTNNTGSAAYMAPEVFATSSYLESGDVFSWSIIFWEILARRHPYAQQYSNPYQILWSVKQANTRPNELLDCPEPIWNLITESWNKDPKARPSMQSVAKRMEFIYSLTDKHDNPSRNMQHSKQTKLPTQHHQHFLQGSPNHIESPIGSQPSHSDQSKIPLFADLLQHQQSTSDFRWLNIGREDPSRNIDNPGQSTNCRSQYSDRGRERCNHLRALAYLREMLRRREKILELELSHQRKDKSDDTLEELKELMRETKSRKMVLKERHSTSLSQKLEHEPSHLDT